MRQVKQYIVPLENVADIVRSFEDMVIDDFNLKNDCSAEIQTRNIGIQSTNGEMIKSSDDKITYILKNDKMIAMYIIRRNDFNNAEITTVIIK